MGFFYSDPSNDVVSPVRDCMVIYFLLLYLKLKTMDKDLEKKIEEAATKKYEKTRGSFSPGSKFLEKVFVEGALSPAAKQYWQQGMYTEEEIINALHQVELKNNRNYTHIWKIMKIELQNKKHF